MDLTPIGSFSGVYLLIINNKKYIGSSKNINKRITEHKRLLRNNAHYNKYLQEAYNINPLVEHYCIEECLEDSLFEIEQKYLDTENPELNMSKIAKNAVLSPELVQEKQGGVRNHMAKITLDQAISVVHARNNKMTLKEISEYTEIPYNIVVSICSANNWRAELEKTIPVEYKLMKDNKRSLGIENRQNAKPSNRLFNDEKLLDILKSLIVGTTLQALADKYDTSKTVISSIKNNKTYKNDISRLLNEEEYHTFMNRIKH